MQPERPPEGGDIPRCCPEKLCYPKTLSAKHEGGSASDTIVSTFKVEAVFKQDEGVPRSTIDLALMAFHDSAQPAGRSGLLDEGHGGPPPDTPPPPTRDDDTGAPCVCACCRFEQWVKSSTHVLKNKIGAKEDPKPGVMVEDCVWYKEGEDTRRKRRASEDPPGSQWREYCLGRRDPRMKPKVAEFDEYYGPGECRYRTFDKPDFSVLYQQEIEYVSTYVGRIRDVCRKKIRAERRFTLRFHLSYGPTPIDPATSAEFKAEGTIALGRAAPTKITIDDQERPVDKECPLWD